MMTFSLKTIRTTAFTEDVPDHLATTAQDNSPSDWNGEQATTKRRRAQKKEEKQRKKKEEKKRETERAEYLDRTSKISQIRKELSLRFFPQQFTLKKDRRDWKQR